jgi:hypothetical protein
VLLGGGERDAVGARHVGREPVERAVRAQPVNAPGRVGNAGLSLVGEVEVAVRGEVEIVEALEALAEGGSQQGFQLAGFRFEHQETLLVAGDEGTAILVKLQPVRPAVVLDDQLPFIFRGDAENTAERNVHDPEVSGAVERWAFEEAFHLRALAVGVGPRGAAFLAELRGHRGVDLGLDLLERLEG